MQCDSQVPESAHNVRLPSSCARFGTLPTAAIMYTYDSAHLRQQS